MAEDQFGVQLQELAKLTKDWQSAGERVEEMSRKLAGVKAVIERATATDLAACAAVAGPALVAGLTMAYSVLDDVKAIKSQADDLSRAKDKLSSDLAADAVKLKTVAQEYAAVEGKNHDAMTKHDTHQPAGEVPSAPADPVAAGGGSAPAGGPGGGGTRTAPDSTDGRGDGEWRTVGDWDAWSPGKHHTTQGAGAIKAPDLSGLPDPRRAILDRALERIDHRIGYSQSATTNGYRDDCSGFVSAAWGLQPPGTNTYGLMGSAYAHPVTKDDLQPGDALIAGDHVVLFGGWADASHTQYIALEDNGSQGTVSHVIPYPYYSGDAAHERSIGKPYVPYRRNGL